MSADIRISKKGITPKAVMAAEMIGANKVMPIHWGAFVLSSHGWDNSPKRSVAEAEKRKRY